MKSSIQRAFDAIVLVTLSAATLALTTATPGVALSERFERAHQQNLDKLSERFEEPREQNLDKLSERFEESREQNLDKLSERFEASREQNLDK